MVRYDELLEQGLRGYSYRAGVVLLTHPTVARKGGYGSGEPDAHGSRDPGHGVARGIGPMGQSVLCHSSY